MPYAWIVASCSVGCLLSDCSLDLVFPLSLAVLSAGSTLKPVELPLHLGFPPIELWDSFLAWWTLV